MDKEYLVDLIERLSGVKDHKVIVGSQSISWMAHREVENIREIDVLDDLQKLLFVESSQKKIAAIFIILRSIGINAEDSSTINLMIRFLSSEAIKEFDRDILYQMMSSTFETGLNYQEQISGITYWVDDQDEMVRNTAIRLLGLTSNHKNEAENVLIDVIENAYDDYGIQYAADSLFEVGSNSCLSILKSSLTELESQDAIYSARRTIRKFKI